LARERRLLIVSDDGGTSAPVISVSVLALVVECNRTENKGRLYAAVLRLVHCTAENAATTRKISPPRFEVPMAAADNIMTAVFFARGILTFDQMIDCQSGIKTRKRRD